MAESTTTRCSRSRGWWGSLVVLIVIAVGTCGCDDPVPHGLGDSTGSNSAGINCEATRRGEKPPSAHADLRSCDLSGMDLSNVTLRDAGLFVANLAHTSLVGADLSEASLSYSNAWGADFTDADLSEATLTGANLTGVIWSNTTCPDGSNSDSHGNTCVGYGV